MWCWLLTLGIVIVGLIVVIAFGVFFTWFLEKIPHPFDAIFLGTITIILIIMVVMAIYNDICK